MRADCGTIPAQANASRFAGVSGVEELHLTIHPECHADFAAQLLTVERAYAAALRALGVPPGTAVFRRFFCSDLANQAAALAARKFSNPGSAADPCAVSWVRQPSGFASKVALWAYHVTDGAEGIEKSTDGATLSMRRGGLAHHWTTGVTCVNAESAHDQTRVIFAKYDAFLQSRRMTLADNALRTWLFVQGIDTNYHGLVRARAEYFAGRGLTARTHFIASTGIEGAHADPAALVSMDAYAVSGIVPGQVEHLCAPEWLSPTHLYGVTFERATAVAYRDRRHVILSGTASINHQGKILHAGDMPRQLGRTLENMETLLAQAGATLADMAVVIAYVRDPADHALATRLLRERFGDAPIQVGIAAVCRPGWLVEVEGIALVGASNAPLPEF
jgi:enamine deaminase RidA (YjgF/YER057c/UK114 family)